jgi:hypothetical protein
MSYDVISLDPQFTNKVEAAQQTKGQVVFVVDSWAAQLNDYDGIFAEVDKERYRSCPMLVPLNNKDEENHRKQSQLLEALAKRLPGRAATGGLAFMASITDEFDYQAQLGRALATRQSELVGTMSPPPAIPAPPLPNI